MEATEGALAATEGAAVALLRESSAAAAGREAEGRRAVGMAGAGLETAATGAFRAAMGGAAGVPGPLSRRS